MEFPYKHSTGETVGRFLAGLKEQKKIWGRRVAGQGVVVPPIGYSEIDAAAGGEWVEVKDDGDRHRRRRGRAAGRATCTRSRSRSPSCWSSSTAPTRRWRTSSRTHRRAARRLARQGGVGGGRASASGTIRDIACFRWSADRGGDTRMHERATRRNAIKYIQTDLNLPYHYSPATTRRAICARSRTRRSSARSARRPARSSCRRW